MMVFDLRLASLRLPARRRAPFGLAPVLLASTALFATGAFADEFRPERILLSSGGLAEISATVPVSGRTVITFDAPLAQVDDILKSLIILGNGLEVRSVDLAGREPLSDAFTALPLSPADLENSVTLLSALKGIEVEVQRSDRTLRGMVIGVEIVAAGDGADGRRQVARLSVATPAGVIEHVEIDDATRVTILDEGRRAAMLEALQALAADRSAEDRTVAITLDGPADGSATLTYVVGAPVWKPTWRVVLPADDSNTQFQGWAVLENRTGLDWDGVSLTLSSGTPVALTQRLYESVTVPRTEVPLRVGERIRPDLDQGVIPEAQRFAFAPPPAPSAVAGLAMPRGRAGELADFAFGGAIAGGAPVEATESLAAATFRIPGATDLEVGRSLTLPFFQGEAVAERVSVYQPGVSSRHPIAAVNVRNNSEVTLPGGIVTVYEAGVGFVGDAEFAGAAPGEERLLPYALDPKVTIARDTTYDSSLRSARAVDGVLVIDYGRVQKTVYQLEGDPAMPRSLLIEHMANAGWTVDTDGTIDGRDGEKVRIAVSLAAGESRALTVTESTIDAQRWGLIEAPEQVILDLLAVGDRIDPALRAPLAAIIDLRTTAAGHERTIRDADDAIARIRQDQDRVRQNLAAVDRNGDLARTYLERLQRQEEEMARLEGEREAASDALVAARNELSNLVAALGR